MSTTSVTYPHEVDNPSWPVVREWHLSPDRRVLVVNDGNPWSPLQSNDYDCTFYWYDVKQAPDWNPGGRALPYWNGDGMTPDEWAAAVPENAFQFRADECRDGNHYTLADADDTDAAGYIIAPDDATNPREYVAAVLHELTLWATGECYGWVEQSRHHFTSDTTDRELDDWETDESCWGYFGESVMEAVREIDGMEGVAR